MPLAPCTGIFLGPSKSGKTVALISLILEQYRGVFERIYIFSPSVNIDDGWIPVKKYIEEDLGVNTEREQTYWDEWDEAALRRIMQLESSTTLLTRHSCTSLTAPWIRCSSGPAHADQHLGEFPEAEAHQRRVRVNMQFLC